MENLTLLAAFGGGVASFLCPCHLPLIPVYLSSLAGPEIYDPEASRRRIPIFLHSLSFVLGLGLVFTLIGTLAGLIGEAIAAYSTLVQTLSGALLILLGLYMLAALKIPWLNYGKRLSLPFKMTVGYLRSFLIGGAYSLVHTPCITPILLGILTLALNSETVWQATSLMFVYYLGYGLPFLIAGAAFSYIIPLLKVMHRYSTMVYAGAGILLVVIGIMILV